MFHQVKTASKLLLMFIFLTGVVYPLFVTGVAQIFFPWRANGSLIERQGKIIGSELIGQWFTDPKYFWGRPSSTAPFPYNAASSMGSNLGPSNPSFLALVQQRVEKIQKANPDNHAMIPIDLVTASASGLDPDISPRAAFYQIPRIAKARKLTEKKVEALVITFIKKRTWGILGEPRVNVLELNLALEELHS